MQKNKLIASLILIFIIPLLILLWNYGIFTRYNYLTAKIDIYNGNIRLIYYGLPVFSSKQREIDSVSTSYGFRHYNSGCTISAPESKGADIYNNVMEEYLLKRNGNNWRIEYKRVIDSLYNEEHKEKKSRKKATMFSADSSLGSE